MTHRFSRRGAGLWRRLSVSTCINAIFCAIGMGAMIPLAGAIFLTSARSLLAEIQGIPQANVVGAGCVDMESDYVPRVLTCENGLASFEALKAQAVAARTYAYYQLLSRGEIGDGQGDQVYSCSFQPQAIHFQAAADTSCEILTYSQPITDVFGVISSFYVAGALTTYNGVSPFFMDIVSDPTNTERFVTYNYMLTSNGITQTTLGFTTPNPLDFTDNRGCMSQNGADTLSDNGWDYRDILRFYYGEDIEFTIIDNCTNGPQLAGCLPDCNSNGIDDAEDIAAGTSVDCNDTGIPDECELTPSLTILGADFESGLPANWGTNGLWHVTDECGVGSAPDPAQWVYFGKDDTCDFATGAVVQGVLTAPAITIPSNTVTATLQFASLYEGDRGFASVPIGFDLAWVTVNGVLVDDVGPTIALGVWETRAVDLTPHVGQTITLAWNFDSVDAVSNDQLGWQVDAVSVTAFTQNDCNSNGLPDDCEDCNGNTFADSCDLAAGTSADCNTNGAPDECDVAAVDCNSNAVPDECDADFDGDNVPNDCDADIDGDGLENAIDVCDYTPLEEPINPFGGPMGDADDDCAVTLMDYEVFELCAFLSGPGGDPVFDECFDLMDFDLDGDVDLKDFAGFAIVFGP